MRTADPLQLFTLAFTNAKAAVLHRKQTGGATGTATASSDVQPPQADALYHDPLRQNRLILHELSQPRRRKALGPIFCQCDLNDVVLDIAVSELHALGHQVQVSDLYAMNWKTTVDCDDFPSLKTAHRSARDQGFEHLFGFRSQHLILHWCGDWPWMQRGLARRIHAVARETFEAATDPVMKIDPQSLNSGNAFCTVNSVTRTFRLKVVSKCRSVI